MTTHAAEQQLINPSGIARLAGVAPSTVSNWRIRDETFPEPVNEDAARPLFSVAKVTAWLKSRRIQIVERPQAFVLADTIRGAVPVDKFVEVLLPLLCAEHWARHSGASLIEMITSSQDEKSRTGTFDVSQALYSAAQETAELNPFVSSAIYRSLDLTRQAWGDTPKLEHLCSAIAGIRNLSQTADELMEATARNAKSSLNVHSAPRAFARFLDGLLPNGGNSFADLACGFGRTLLTAAETRPAARLTGHDVSESALEAAACQLFLRDLSADLAVSDLLNPESVTTYDRVVLHPPFGLRIADAHRARPWIFGAPPKGQGDLLWPQAAFQRLSENGYAAVVLPTGALSRGGKARDVWARMIARGAIEAIISLPGNSQLNTALPVSVLVLSANPASHHGVLMMRLADTVAFSNRRTDATDEQQWDSYGSAIQILSDWRDGGNGATDISVEVPKERLLAPDAVPTPQSWLAALSPLSENRVEQVAKMVQKSAAALEETARSWEAPPSVKDLYISTHSTPLRPISEVMLCIPRGSYTKPKDAAAENSAAPGRVLTLSSLRSGRPELLPVLTSRTTKPVIAEQGDILVANVGRKIITLVCDEGGAEVDRNLGLVRPSKNEWDADFLAQQLMADHNQAMLSGTTVQRVDIRHLLVPTLPLEEQKAAGDIIRSLMRFVDQTRNASVQAEEYMSAVRNALASGSFKLADKP